MSWPRHVGPALLLPAELVGAPWWAVLVMVLAIVCLRLNKQLCQFWLGRQRLNLCRQALDKAEAADIPAVTAAIMQASAPEDPCEEGPVELETASTRTGPLEFRHYRQALKHRRAAPRKSNRQDLWIKIFEAAR